MKKSFISVKNVSDNYKITTFFKKLLKIFGNMRNFYYFCNKFNIRNKDETMDK